MKLVIIDNYDSFTYNLAHLVRALGAEVAVVRNDRFEPADLAPFDKIILSPGPGIPAEAGRLMDVIATWHGRRPMLGICLGEQAIGQFYGARLENLASVFHGVQTPVDIVADDGLFRSLPRRIDVGRYHSWVVADEGLPPCLEVTARDAGGRIMALRHRSEDVCGVQFHPESVLTPCGKQIIENFLNQPCR